MTKILDEPVLVLNKSWMAINVVTVYDAVVHMVKGSALAVCHESFDTYSFEEWAEKEVNDLAIKTPSLVLPIPEVIVLTKYNKVPLQALRCSRRNIMERDDNQCQYCSKKLTNSTASIDHVLPVSRGGRTTWENCVASCLKCNNKKNNMLPKEARMKLLKEPKMPSIKHGFNFKRTKQSWEKFIH